MRDAYDTLKEEAEDWNLHPSGQKLAKTKTQAVSGEDFREKEDELLFLKIRGRVGEGNYMFFAQSQRGGKTGHREDESVESEIQSLR